MDSVTSSARRAERQGYTQRAVAACLLLVMTIFVAMPPMNPRGSKLCFGGVKISMS